MVREPKQNKGENYLQKSGHFPTASENTSNNRSPNTVQVKLNGSHEGKKGGNQNTK